MITSGTSLKHQRGIDPFKITAVRPVEAVAALVTAISLIHKECEFNPNIKGNKTLRDRYVNYEHILGFMRTKCEEMAIDEELKRSKAAQG